VKKGPSAKLHSFVELRSVRFSHLTDEGVDFFVTVADNLFSSLIVIRILAERRCVWPLQFCYIYDE
jgi:hypothetical protein